MHLRLTLVIAAILASPLSTVVPAAGQPQAADKKPAGESGGGSTTPQERRFALTLQDIPAREAFQTFLRDSPIRFNNQGSGTEGWLIFDPNVPDARITVSFRGVTFPTAVYLLVGALRAQAPGVTWGKESSNYVIKYSPMWGENEREKAKHAVRRKSNEFVGFPLRLAVERWMENRTGRCVVLREVPDVVISVRLEDLEVEEGLWRIVRRAALQLPGLTLSRGGDHFAIHR